MRFADLTARLRAAYHSRIMQAWLVACLILVAASYAVVGTVILPIRKTADAFPYHYTIYFGVDRLGAWYQTFSPAYLATLLGLTNVVVVGLLSERDRAIARLVAVLTLVFLAFTLIGAVFVALLNLS